MPSIEEYVTAIRTPALVKSVRLAGGHPELLQNGSPRRYAGGFCVVFPYQVGNSRVAVRCWHSALNHMRERTKIVSDYLKAQRLPYFVSFDYEEQGVVTGGVMQPVVIMDWVEGVSLKDYIKKHLKDKDVLLRLADDFLKMTDELHAAHISHGDLQHGNILIDKSGGIVLVDYDSVYVPELDGWECEIPGLPGYQHPSRFVKGLKMSEKADYFSELVVYTSLVAIAHRPELWDELLVEDSDTLLFSADDLESKGSAQIFLRLKDIDGRVKQAVDAMVQSLGLSSFDSLQPLSSAVAEPTDKLSAKWGDNGYRKPISVDVDRISRRW